MSKIAEKNVPKGDRNVSWVPRSGTLWSVFLCLTATSACGATSTSEDDARQSSAGGGDGALDEMTGGTTASGGGSDGAPDDTTGGTTASGGSTTSAPDFSALDCSSPWPGYPSCSSSTRCTDSQSAFADAVQSSICLPDLGMYPSEEACSSFGMLGRCFVEANEYWLVDYRGGSESTATAAVRTEMLGAQCEESGGIWCENPFGVSPETAAHCKAICAESRPDYSLTPECDWSDSCEYSCWAAAENAGCEDCIFISFWEAPGCNDFECQCPGPVFGQP